MRISLVSINSLTSIPVIRFIVEYLYDKGDSLTISETHLSDSNSYFKESKRLRLNYYRVFKCYNDSLESTKKNFFSKYVKLARVVFRQMKLSDCIYTNDFQVLFLVFILKYFVSKPVKIVYHQFEVIAEEKLNRVNKFLLKIVIRNINHVSLAILPEQNRLEYFISQTNYKGETCLIPNSCQLSEVKLDVGKVAKKKTILHVGSVGGANHYFDSILKVMEILKDKPIDFVFVGRQSKEVKEKFESLSLPNATFYDSVPHEELLVYYRRADLGLILYKDTGINYKYCAPNKLYEMWSNGLPVIGHTLDGLVNVFKKKIQGELVDFEDEEMLAAVILNFHPDMNVKSKLLTYFENKLEIDHFLPLLDKINK